MTESNRQAELLTLLADVELIDLGREFATGMPTSPNHPGFRMALLRRHGDVTKIDGSSSANELIITGGHVGTHVDALSHASYLGKLFGGRDALDAQSTGSFSELGAETIPPMLCRGLFFDVAKQRDLDVLPGGYAVTAADLEDILDRAELKPRPGDVAVVRTGWGTKWNDQQAYVGFETGVPGLNLDAARWLAASGFQAVGVDTTACEQVAPLLGHATTPVHNFLLVEAGIYMIEHMLLEKMAAAEVIEFTFVMTPLPIVGATGSPVRPLAAVIG